MLSTLLSQLQSYFSKYFVIGNFCPILVFTFFNGATLYFLFAEWRKWIDANIINSGVTRGAFIVSSITIGMVLFAYVLSSLSTVSLRLLEGHWWYPLAKLFITAQNSRRERLRELLQTARYDMIDLRAAIDWQRRLKESRIRGTEDYPMVAFEMDLESPPHSSDVLQKYLEDLESLQRKNRRIPPDHLESAVKTLSERFETHNVDLGIYLDNQHRRLLALIDYANERSRMSYTRLLNELHTSFGVEEVAPTKMGNIANTMQSYALRRYQCNLEAIWSNLQRVVQRDDKAQAALQESKTQLDFLVACSWLTLGWAIIWTVVFTFIAPSRVGFIAAAGGGPLMAYVWYRAAAEQYRSFADVAMTTLDSFRFALLDEMRLRTPDDVEDERYLWESLDQLTTYSEERNFRYVKPAS